MLSFRDVLTITGATRSQLIYWTHEDVVQAVTAGTGHHRRFGFGQLVEVRVAVLLAARGFSLEALRFVLRALRPLLRRPQPPAIVWVQTDGPAAGSVWTGTAAEFSREMKQPFGILGMVGIVIRLQDVIAGLRDVTAG